MATPSGIPAAPEAGSLSESSPIQQPKSSSSADAFMSDSEDSSNSTTEFSGRSSPQSGSPESAGGPKGRKRVRQVHRWKSTLRKERTNARQQLPANFLQIQLSKLGEAAIVHEL